MIQLSKMKLGNVITAPIDKPFRAVIYGTEGVGKTTLAARAPKPVFIGTEDGLVGLAPPRFPQPETFDDILEAIRELTDGEHAFESVVFDTLDWLEPLVWAKVCRDGGKTDIEDFGYGKGYAAAVDVWRSFLSRLDALREKRKMAIVLLAHAVIKPFKNPSGQDFDRYQLALHGKSAELIKQWADMVLFATYETFTVEKAPNRSLGVDNNGARVLYTERRAAFDAKNRFSLPARMPLSWDELVTAIKLGPQVESMRTQIAALVPGLDDATRKKVEAWIKDAGNDGRKLAQLLDFTKSKTATNQNETKEVA
jgi:AAA domain